MKYIKYHLQNSKVLGPFLVLWGILTILSHFRDDHTTAMIMSITWIGIFVSNLILDYFAWKKLKKRNDID